MTPTPDDPHPLADAEHAPHTEAQRLRARALFDAALNEDERMRHTHPTYAHARRAERQANGEEY